jgi:cathepsin L
MKIALILCVLTAAVFAVPVKEEDEWTMFKKAHGKTYKSNDEEAVRQIIFEKKLKYIRKWNLEHDLGQHSYRLGVNKYSDLTHEEFIKQMNGYKMGNKTKSTGSKFLAPGNYKIPDAVDWRKKGYVTEVKDQAQCGSCWAFSTTGSLEGQHFKSTGNLVSISEQNLVDCSWDEGNMGCNGGLMDQAFTYIKKNKGIDTEDSYPYEGVDGDCRFKKSTVGATDTGYTDITSGDEDALQQAIATVGPISVAIDASHESFQSYESGVYDEPDCSSSELDHGVLAVGYDTDDSGTPYYIVKNSWGTSWGQDGYLWMSRNKDNQCGIATSASYPLV